MPLLTTTNSPPPPHFYVMEFDAKHAYEAGKHARAMSLQPEFQCVSMVLKNPDIDFNFQAAYADLNLRGHWGRSCENNALHPDYREMSQNFGSVFDVFATVVACYNQRSWISATGYAAPSNTKTHIDGPGHVVEDADKQSVVMTLCINEAGTDLVQAPPESFSRNPHGWNTGIYADKSDIQIWHTGSMTLNIMRMSNWPVNYLPCPHRIPENKAYLNPALRTILIARPSLACY